MGYDLNKRKISQSRERVFSLIVSDSSYVNTFFWSEVVKGMEMRMKEKNIGLDLVVYNDSTLQDRMLLDLIDRKTNGLMIVSSSHRSRIEVLKKSALPLVVVDGDRFFGTDCDGIYASNYQSCYQAARYLLDKGHRSLGFVGSADYAMSFLQRRNGFRDGVERSGLEATYCEVSEPGDRRRYETFCSRKLRALMRKVSRPTALLCGNDYTATKVADVLGEMGLRVPEDVSRIGFDDVRRDHPLIPRLTTFGIDKKAFGCAAVDLLCDRIAAPNAPARLVELSAVFRERDSVRPISR